MRAETVYLMAATDWRSTNQTLKPYYCVHNRVYQDADEVIKEAEQYTSHNYGVVAVVLSFNIERGLVVEATYSSGHSDVRHTMGVRECVSVYAPYVLLAITGYLDTICRASAEEELSNV